MGFGDKLKATFGTVNSGDSLRPAPYAGEDKMGAYPADVSVPALEGKRQLFTTRVFALAFTVSMLLNVVLAFTLSVLMPLKRVEPFLLTFSDKSQQIVRVEPISKDASGFQLLIESMANEFVKIREEVIFDEQEQQRRWTQYIRPRVPQRDFEAFLKEMADVYPKLRDAGLGQTVEIVRTQRVSQNTIEVYFDVTAVDRRGTVKSRDSWIARISFGFRQQAVSLSEQYLNPLGFTVLNYQRVKAR
ncbi:MAG: VirB8/TrbF family protein [Holosporales bacterium]|jgi:type IV secretory pathway component VirB8